MVIEEVTAIQENLEIERACRESAEALASKVHFILRQIQFQYNIPRNKKIVSLN